MGTSEFVKGALMEGRASFRHELLSGGIAAVTRVGSIGTGLVSKGAAGVPLWS